MDSYGKSIEVNSFSTYSGNLGWYQWNKQAGCTPELATNNKKTDTRLNILNFNIISTSFQLVVATCTIYTRLEIKCKVLSRKGQNQARMGYITERNYPETKNNR